MPYNFGNLPANAATELVFSQYEQVEAGFERVRYSELQWRDVLPEASVLTDINPGATSWSKMILDGRGKGAFRGRNDKSVPTVAMGLDKAFVPIEVGGVTGVLDREDIRQWQFGQNTDLLTETPELMRMAGERHFEGTLFYGDADVGFASWLDYPGVSVDTAPNGAGGSPLWANKTVDEIIADINDTITSVYVNSKMVHLPGHIALSGELLATLASRRVPNTNTNLLEYVKMNNMYTLQRGQPLTIIPIRYLNDAGAGGTSRMIVWEMDDRNIKVPMPIPFTLLPPQEDGYSIKLHAEYKFGSVYIPFTQAYAYLDGL